MPEGTFRPLAGQAELDIKRQSVPHSVYSDCNLPRRSSIIFNQPFCLSWESFFCIGKEHDFSVSVSIRLFNVGQIEISNPRTHYCTEYYFCCSCRSRLFGEVCALRANSWLIYLCGLGVPSARLWLAQGGLGGLKILKRAF